MPVLKITWLAAIVVYFFIIIQMLRYKKLALKYTLLWLLFGFVLLFFLEFPVLIEKLADFMGFELASNAILAVGIFCIIVIMVFLTSVISTMNNKIKLLSQKLALAEERVRKLEAQKQREEA